MGNYTYYTSDDACHIASRCFTIDECDILLRDGRVAWDARNFYEVEEAYKDICGMVPYGREYEREVKRRRKLTELIISRLRNVNCDVDVDCLGYAKISISENIVTPIDVACIVYESRLGILNVRFNSIYKVTAVGEVPIFQANLTALYGSEFNYYNKSHLQNA